MKNKWLWLLLVPLLISCTPTQKNDKLQVAVSIAPLADLTQRIGGEHIDVFTIIPTGANAHTFELTAMLMAKIAQSDLLVLNGKGLEFWQDKVAANAAQVPVCIASTGIMDLSESDDDHAHHDHAEHAHHNHDDHGHVHAEGNPHVWLDPLWAAEMAQEITEALIAVDPEHSEAYRHNFSELYQSLHNLHAEIENEIESWQQKRFVCFHPAWAYFADRYGLVQAGVIEKRPGNEPTPQDIVEIIKIIQEIQAKAIFAEAQFPSKTSDMIAKESDIVVIPLDPLGGSGNISDYFELLRYNVSQMAKGLKFE